MGISFSRRTFFLFSIAVAAIVQGCNCDDGSGLAKVCQVNRPCGITNAGSIVLADNFKDYDLYRTGECKFGTIQCDSEGKESCVGFVSPGPEICDGLDNDCNGEVDETFDQDSDGYTSCAGDCDDTRKEVNPAAKDICDGLDNDCNDQIDENIPPISCWGGPSNAITDGTTSCKRGQSFCTNGKCIFIRSF